MNYSFVHVYPVIQNQVLSHDETPLTASFDPMEDPNIMYTAMRIAPFIATDEDSFTRNRNFITSVDYTSDSQITML